MHILSHLPPTSLAEVSFVSRRFNDLVTTPHAWRIAFSRFFPGTEALNALDDMTQALEDEDLHKLERRSFTRLTGLASWRSEYILRTELIRSLTRGRPADPPAPGVSASSRSNAGQSNSAQITYNSNLVTTVNHIHGTFDATRHKNSPRFLLGADDVGSACWSDPKTGRVDQWGFADPLSFVQFADRFPGDELYGLGTGDIVGAPNVMDVSQPYGMVYGEGLPGGVLYYRAIEERRGRTLTWEWQSSNPNKGIPSLWGTETICSVWVAKSVNIPDASQGLIGILSGSSNGIISAFSLGTNNLQDRRLERGEMTARWVLSPGVPIIAIVVDDDFSPKRKSLNRIWAVALNALGETFYLREFPTRPLLGRGRKLTELRLEELAWESGRTVTWTLVEPSRRTAKPDPYGKADVDGSYTPRGSWNGMGLSKEQVAAETKEIEMFIRKMPKDFRSLCEGWDMQRRLEVDFAAGDGESVSG